MDLSLTKLTEALSIRNQINALESRLSSLFGGGSSSSSTASRKPVSQTPADVSRDPREARGRRQGAVGSAKRSDCFRQSAS